MGRGIVTVVWAKFSLFVVLDTLRLRSPELGPEIRLFGLSGPFIDFMFGS